MRPSAAGFGRDERILVAVDTQAWEKLCKTT